MIGIDRVAVLADVEKAFPLALHIGWWK